MKKLLPLFLILFSTNTFARWLDTSGTVTSITTYAGTETILVSISSEGTDIEECSNSTAFAISASLSSEARARMYAMLLAAQASNRTVVISYNDVGGCEPWDGAQNVFRQIVRLR
ncbi:MAG: hypothetical protein AAGB12_05200 [Pseudomonadota bacterium]